jgi:hypothetical protein
MEGTGLVTYALLALLAGVAVYLALSKRRLDQRRAAEERNRLTAEARADAAAARVVALEQENAALSVYRPIVDATREAENIRAAAYGELQNAQQQGQAIVAQARSQALATETAARTQALAIEAASKNDATKIVSDAHAEAQRIAADAFRAREEVEPLRREVKALENVIKGYGDQYIVPAHSVLDDLAESFGFNEAGQKLKQARERTRQLTRGGTAATCDYAEANRRQTAIAFVLDAFNGKVDSILSLVKEDNVGTLRQKIKDAFALVNMNGQAFRNARITDDYLAARLQELEWAAAAQELKNREREEQRRIKEQIREEEKARREYERAIRDAEKEEEAIKKAMERIQKDVAKASDEQRQRYEAQLAELAQKLTAAEEKNRRALSMAQQTKTGHVYVISNIGSFGEDVFKIGLTRRLEPLDRIRELGDASVPFEFDVHAMILSEDAPALEHSLHRHFLASQMNKVNPRKEFFRVPIATIREEIEKLGIQASWTMASAAAEYKQSLAIEKAIRENPASYEAWVNKQLILDAEMAVMDERDMAEAS